MYGSYQLSTECTVRFYDFVVAVLWIRILYKKGNEPCPVLSTRIAIQKDKEQCPTVTIYSSTNQDFEPYSTNKTQVELNIP
jgi:hypothetical protein